MATEFQEFVIARWVDYRQRAGVLNGNSLRRQARVIEDDPGVQQRPVDVEEITDAPIVAAADSCFGNVMAALPNPVGDSAQGKFHCREPEEVESDDESAQPALSEQLLVTKARKGCLEGEIDALLDQAANVPTMIRPAATAANCGAKGDSPAAIRSAFTN